MKRFLLLPAVALALSACSDPTTSPTGTPTLTSRFTTVFSDQTAPTGAHYANGASEPRCSISGLSISCTGTQINGVGNTNANLLLDVTYSATCRCRNHGGQIVDVKSQIVDDGAFDTDLAPKNGNLQGPAIDVSSSEAPSDADVLAQATCPNGNWTKELLAGTPSITGYSYTLTFVGFSSPAITLP